MFTFFDRWGWVVLWMAGLVLANAAAAGLFLLLVNLLVHFLST